MKKIILLSFCLSAVAFTEETTVSQAITRDGKIITLNDDSTWKIVTNTDIAALSASEVLGLFLNASNMEERLKYVLEPDSVAELMHKYYTGTGKIFADVSVINPSSTPNQNGWYTLFASVVYKDKELKKRGHILRTYYLKQTAAGVKIDWKSTIGYNPISTEVYIETQPQAAQDLKLKLKLITGQLNEKVSAASKKLGKNIRKTAEKSWGFAMYDSLNNFLGWGYADKNSETGKKLFEILKDNNEHQMIVTLECKTKPVTIAERYGVFCEIKNVIAVDTWCTDAQ